jgi:hypothetical protein
MKSRDSETKGVTKLKSCRHLTLLSWESVDWEIVCALPCGCEILVPTLQREYKLMTIT